MHEWALAESVITAALQEAEKEKLKKILEIKIGLGELQQIEKDIFKFALDQIIKEHSVKLKGVKIKFVPEKGTLKCRNCENKWNFSETKKKLNKDESEAVHFIPEVAFVYLRCPKCSSFDFEIMTGRGVTIRSIKGEK